MFDHWPDMIPLYWPVLIPLLAASVVLPPLALWWLIRRSPLSPFLVSFAGVGTSFMGVMSVLFSLTLAFVCNDIWQSREVAKLAMSQEADALRNIARVAYDIPGRGGMPIIEADRQYLEAVDEIDFPKTQAIAGNSAGSSLPAVIKLSDAILDAKTLEKMSPSVQTFVLEQLSVVRDRRLERIDLKNIAPNPVKWFSLLFLEFMALLTIAVVHVANGRALFMACFLYLAAINPLLVLLYDSRSPFTGINPLPNVSFAAALDRLKSLENGPQ
jgi:hypothetical protein